MAESPPPPPPPPTPVVTERWSDRAYKRGESGRRGFDVTAVTTEEEARQAVPIAVNDTFVYDGRLRATQPDVSRTGPASFHAVVDFQRGEVFEDPDDPLAAPPKFTWGRGSRSFPTDVDAENNPIVNAGGFPFDGGTSAEVRYKTLVITSNESSFDLAESLQYENKVNDEEVELPGFVGGGSLEPGQLLCVAIEPVGEYDANSTYVVVRREFWMARGNREDDDDLWDAWKKRVLNVGRYGFWDNDGTPTVGQFVTAKGVPISDPVRLDTEGKPFDESIKVEKEAGVGADPVASPLAVSSELYEETADAVFIKFYDYPSTDLSPVFAAYG